LAEVTIRLPAAPPEAYLRYLAWWEALDRFLADDPAAGPAPQGALWTGATNELAADLAEQLRAQARIALDQGRATVSPILRGDPVVWRIRLGYAARRGQWVDRLAADDRPVPVPDPDLIELRHEVRTAVVSGLGAAEGLLRVEPAERPGGYRLIGELDMTNADRLTAVLESEMDLGYRITLDMSELTFMDSTGIRMLIRLARHARTTETAPVELIAPSPSVTRILGMAVPGGIPDVEIRSDGEGSGPGSRSLRFFCL